MSLFFPGLSLAGFFGAPLLREGGIESAHYELVKLVDGEIDGLLSVQGQTGAVAVVPYREVDGVWEKACLLRIDGSGHLAGKTSRNGLGSPAFQVTGGEREGTKGFEVSDWLATGRQEKTFLDSLVPAAEMTDSVLQAAIDQSRGVQFLWIDAHHKPGLTMILRGPDGFTGYDISHLEPRMRSKEAKAVEEWKHYRGKVDSLEGFRLPPAELSLLKNLTPPFPYDFPTDEPCPLAVKGFSRRALHFREGFLMWALYHPVGWLFISFVGGFGGGQGPYAYWGGYGSFALEHGGETLRFRAAAATSHWLGRTSYRHLQVYRPEGDTKLLFLRVTYPGGEYEPLYRDENMEERARPDVGLYVVRPKASLPGP